MYIQFKSENCLAVACLEKNSEFRWFNNQNKRNKAKTFFKYSLFRINVKELLKSNETHS